MQKGKKNKKKKLEIDSNNESPENHIVGVLSAMQDIRNVENDGICIMYYGRISKLA